MYSNKDKILKYIEEKGTVSVHELTSILNIGSVMIHRHIKKLVEDGILTKIGKSPKVYYVLANEVNEKFSYDTLLDSKVKNILEENFLLLTPDGKEIVGVKGFEIWCKERNYDVGKKSLEYAESIKEYNHFKKDGFIDATQKLDITFIKEKYLDCLYYLHPYSIPIFGKTKIALWLFHAKQTQNKMLMKKVLDIVESEIQNFIEKVKPDAIAYVPPTVPRSIQFMRELEKRVKTNLPKISIEKIKTPIMIQQKSLKDVNDRIKNAENTLHVIGYENQFKKLLVIDDFTGSGSTLNVIAYKCKKQKIAKEVIGLTITGSMNGFDVIREI